MPTVDTPFSWAEVGVAFAVLAVAAFMVTWLVTDVLRIRRPAYVAILAVVVAALSAGFLAWADVSAGDLATSNAGWGALGGILAAAAVFPLVRKLPAGTHARGARLGAQLLWEGGVYGIAEALLLATLPVLVLWQAVPEAGGEFGWQRIGWGALCVLGSLVIIAVHHVGYREFRARSGRTKLVGALFSCGLQALAFLLTGSILAPVVAHILLHVQMIVRGVEMPPAAAGLPETGASGTDRAIESRREPVGV